MFSYCDEEFHLKPPAVGDRIYDAHEETSKMIWLHVSNTLNLRALSSKFRAGQADGRQQPELLRLQVECLIRS